MNKYEINGNRLTVTTPSSTSVTNYSSHEEAVAAGAELEKKDKAAAAARDALIVKYSDPAHPALIAVSDEDAERLNIDRDAVVPEPAPKKKKKAKKKKAKVKAKAAPVVEPKRTKEELVELAMNAPVVLSEPEPEPAPDPIAEEPAPAPKPAKKAKAPVDAAFTYDADAGQVIINMTSNAADPVTIFRVTESTTGKSELKAGRESTRKYKLAPGATIELYVDDADGARIGTFTAPE